MTYTVQVYNALLKSTRYVGTFATLQEAAEYVVSQAARSRSFARYQIFTGKPRDPMDPVGEPVNGTQ